MELLVKIDYYIVLTRHKAAAYISLYAMANNKQGTKKATGPIIVCHCGHILRSSQLLLWPVYHSGMPRKPGLVEQ